MERSLITSASSPPDGGTEVTVLNELDLIDDPDSRSFGGVGARESSRSAGERPGMTHGDHGDVAVETGDVASTT